MASSERRFRAPNDLAVHATALRRVAVIGSCLMEAWPEIIAISEEACAADFFLVNNRFTLPAETACLHEYDFQIIQIPLRSVLPEQAYFNLSYSDIAGYELAFDDARSAMLVFLDSAMRWNRERGLQSFVLNFLEPQQNPQGRLLPRYDLRNPIYFVEKLNEALSEAVATYQNAYVFDLDQVVCTYGRRYFQDDHVWQINHGSALSNADAALDGERLDGAFLASETYPNRVFEIIREAWEEIVGCYRTIRQVDAVKIVIFDLDDTLWRGVAAERSDVDAEMLEGWPLGLVEAAGFMKRRGILLAIVSKNDREVIERIWTELFQGRLHLEDFAVSEINWRSKAENVEAVLAATNLLARSAVFIDDNPVERAAVQQAFPDIRVIGGNPLLWRRLILWAPELQTVAITEESTTRTEMVRAQINRDHERSVQSRDVFLGSLGLQLDIVELTDSSDPSFARVLELLNKTNQFNTTG